MVALFFPEVNSTIVTFVGTNNSGRTRYVFRIFKRPTIKDSVPAGLVYALDFLSEFLIHPWSLHTKRGLPLVFLKLCSMKNKKNGLWNFETVKFHML